MARDSKIKKRFSRAEKANSRSKKKILSYLLILVGLALVFQGYHVSDSVDSQITQAITGSSSDEALMYYIAGVICLIAGIVL
jgi:TRAP-type C4-dicarboxylate transport system permease large subunit